MLNSEFMIGFCMALVCQTLAWLWQLKYKNADSVDLAWSLSISLIALYYILSSDAAVTNKLFVTIFPVLWYARLSLHLWLRIDKNHEDSRYSYLRAYWHQNRQIKFMLFFIFQAGLSFLFSLPAHWVLISPAIPVAILIFAYILGFLFLIGVSVSDWQLLKFKSNQKNKGHVCDRGLWRYSRHPNYFFEWVHWWLYPLVMFSSDYFWWSVVVVFMMLYFLLKLTGIPFSEQQALRSRGDVYRTYQKNTSAFILWRKK